MRYSAQITVRENVADIEKLFRSEEKEFANNRARYEVVRNKDSLVFKASAKDASALRAVLGSISKMLAVHDKTRGAIEGDLP
ncbi:hypothetical protein JW826_03025 [Candidatus Woesearchaeota archaeon]|nr:hypothetical protein [Candidatus Woesearchaeota archaeon]